MLAWQHWTVDVAAATEEQRCPRGLRPQGSPKGSSERHDRTVDVAAAVQQLGSTSQGLVTAARLLRAGASRSAVSRATAAGSIVRLGRGVYSLAELPALPRHVVTASGVAAEYVARVRCVLLVLGPGAVASGRTAAALYGWGLLVEPRSVEVAVRHGSGTGRPGATQRRTLVRLVVRVLPGTSALQLTAPVQTVLDCCRSLPTLQAVVVCDSALRAGTVTVEELVRAVGHLPGLDGAERARRVLGMCDPSSGSVLESVLRVRLMQAGVRGFATQAVLSRRPRTIRVDLCFHEARLVVEVDGWRWHQDAARDQARDNALAVLGWRVLRLSWAAVVHEPERAVADVRAALAVAGHDAQVVG